MHLCECAEALGSGVACSLLQAFPNLEACYLLLELTNFDTSPLIFIKLGNEYSVYRRDAEGVINRRVIDEVGAEFVILRLDPDTETTNDI